MNKPGLSEEIKDKIQRDKAAAEQLRAMGVEQSLDDHRSPGEILEAMLAAAAVIAVQTDLL